VGSIFEGGKEAWVEGDLDLGLVVADDRKTRDAGRVSLYKGIDGVYFGGPHTTIEGRK
jgi:hypothetical protein